MKGATIVNKHAMIGKVLTCPYFFLERFLTHTKPYTRPTYSRRYMLFVERATFAPNGICTGTQSDRGHGIVTPGPRVVRTLAAGQTTPAGMYDVYRGYSDETKCVACGERTRVSLRRSARRVVR